MDEVIPRSGLRVEIPDGATIPRSGPKLLKVPDRLRTAGDVLNTALRMDLDEVIVLSQKPEGGLIWLAQDGMTCERSNWLLDTFKQFLLGSGVWERKED